ncbi:MAG TPA: ATP-binding protein [Candidatus Dormibacteraeota bacterium]|nr:ATP-binding protein [Candidatus Dormibacteraeota bacterium]
MTTPRPLRALDEGEDPGVGVRLDAERRLADAPPTPVAARLSFRARLTLALLTVSILPLASFAVVLLLVRLSGVDETVVRVLLFAIAVIVAVAILVAYILAADLTAPLRTIATALDRATAGDLATPIVVPGDDELARLAESHNRLAADLERRNRELRRILAATSRLSPRDSVDHLADLAGARARDAFGMIDAAVYLGDPRMVPAQEVVPGESIPIRAELRVGDEPLGVLYGRLPATRRWEPADQDLLELFASEVAIAIRNAQLFAQVDAQNVRLLELDAAKDDFLRGVSHNLQTPLASIRAYAGQLESEREDRRLGIVVEQADLLSRMVRQLLTVSRLESGALRPKAEVLALAPRVRRTWEALGVGQVELRFEDRSAGWLAVADPDQLDQVFWALLDNAVKYGRGTPIEVIVAAEPDAGQVRVTIADHGPGVTEEDRGRLFTRFERGANGSGEDGSGLGLYVSRELCRAMAGDLALEPSAAGRGAAFTILLPGEPGEES